MDVLRGQGGRVKGERLAGDLIGGGGDWPLIGPDGLARVDVRLQLRTDDGAAIYITYVGVLELNEAVQQPMAGQDPARGDQHIRPGAGASIEHRRGRYARWSPSSGTPRVERVPVRCPVVSSREVPLPRAHDGARSRKVRRQRAANIQRWTEMKRGGHFPALEALDAPTSDLAANLAAGDSTEPPIRRLASVVAMTASKPRRPFDGRCQQIFASGVYRVGTLSRERDAHRGRGTAAQRPSAAMLDPFLLGTARKWSSEPLLKQENRAVARFSEPSAGLEPATPSLPWKCSTN